jgi:hypothetical protein
MVEISIREWKGDAEAAVIEASRELGLTISTDGSLSKYPGSRHWHLKNAKRPGTLEVTYWRREQRLWLAYHSNRRGDGWVTEFAERMAANVAARLGGFVDQTPESDGTYSLELRSSSV